MNDAAVNGEACTLVAADGKFVLSKYRFLKDVIKNRQILSDLAVILSRQPNVWSEWRESNSRPLEPHSSALPNCATPGRTGLSRISLFIIADYRRNVNTFFEKNSKKVNFSKKHRRQVVFWRRYFGCIRIDSAARPHCCAPGRASSGLRPVPIRGYPRFSGQGSPRRGLCCARHALYQWHRPIQRW